MVAAIGVDHVEGVTRIYKDTFASAENDVRAEESASFPTRPRTRRAFESRSRNV